jgi:thioredoxin reductase (NADPH)
MATAPDPFDQRREQMFPRLDPAQIERIARHGTRQRLRKGEILFDQGSHGFHFHVVIEGTIEIVRPHDGIEDAITTHHPGEFTGETSLLAGRRSLVRARAGEDGEVLVLEADALRSLVQTDSELSELIMRAFILRRVSLISRGWGDVVIVGSQHSPATLRLRQFLTRNAHPHLYLDLDGDEAVQATLDRFGIAGDEIPVLICRGELVLRNPSFREVAECLGLNAEIDVAIVRDLLVVGAGPSGLAAAVYGASEGLDVLVLEKHAPGGQAGASSRIENYLGFPTGISGQALAGRAFTQAEKFGAHIAIADAAARFRCEKRPFAIELSSGDVVRARAIVIASGARYRKPALENLAAFEGAGIYYAATSIESQICGGEEIVIVGGGNSAGQAAVYLAESVKHVHLLVRADGLGQSMSRYLIRRIEEHPRITMRVRTEVVALEGQGHLEQVRWRSSASGETESRPIRHVFVMTGAEPNTTWLADCIALDDKRFVKTGPDLSAQDLAAAEWPLARAPYLLETSVPGIFAVGDVRSGNVKRVASAVGEGSISVQLVHKALAE